MALLMRMSESKAIRKIATVMPGALAANYGGPGFYTPGQVATTLDQIGVPEDFLDIGYALFCTEEDFKSVCDSSLEDVRRRISDGSGDVVIGGSASDFSSAHEAAEGTCGDGD